MPQGWTPVDEPKGWTPVEEERTASPTVSSVAKTEPDTYWLGALKGAKEGIAGGAKGFVAGMAQSPVSFVNGIVSLLTTNPLTTASEAIEAIKRLPDAIRQAGGDPEGWGQGVGDLTGQTMIGMAAPAAAQGAVRWAKAVAASPITQRVAPSLVRHAATAAGAGIGGPAGAIVGSGIGESIAEAMRGRPAAQGATSLPGYPRLVVREAAAPAAAEAVGEAAPVAAKTARLRPDVSYKAAKDAFEAIGETPLRAEAANAMDLIGRGKSPEEAIQIVMRNRHAGVAQAVEVAKKMPPMTAEEVKLGQSLMARGKTFEEAMAAIQAQRAFLTNQPGSITSGAVRQRLDLLNAQGKIKTPSAETAAQRRQP